MIINPINEAAGSTRAALNVERLTKNFYNKYRAEHQAFLQQIKGIPDQEDGAWYASLMLNRLMFLYFIQRKRFLDGDPDYLRNRLKLMQERYGKDETYSFYRTFLLRLFHEGLGGQPSSTEIVRLLGRVPYLNGGLFEVHQLETQNREIKIPDTAFERIFEFFDEYDWRLDDRPLRDEREINPDILGYIFEKYVNQKQMGAYYTKEDITEYISRNTIIPSLFDRAARDCPTAFHPTGGVWKLLRENPDRYIYAAVRHGVVDEEGRVIELPEGRAAGIDDPEKRGGRNRQAGEPYALPTETRREYVARRQRCLELREKIRRGEIKRIDDFITYNLDIRRFARDVIRRTDSTDLLQAFYRAIAGRAPEKAGGDDEHGLSVLDPTCGSGAFLFAALNILQPIYEACLDRMEAFVAEADAAGARVEQHAQFRRVLEQVERHPNRNYFILKSIIIGNLYGVDLMREAVEICKLRLFLKLAAEVERDESKSNYGLEPLPDLDFNIRAGNTLVGFVDKAAIDDAFAGEEQGKFYFDDHAARFNEDAEMAERAFQRFQQQQTQLGGAVTPKDKSELRSRLKELSGRLDLFLARAYRIDTDQPLLFERWRKSHHPFHWYTEFYRIIKSGGFDVIIGNPPYISAAKARQQFKIKWYRTSECSDIYANVLERSARLLKRDGRTGMIVPLSLSFSGEFAALRKLLFNSYSGNWFSSFARIPAALFSADVRVRNTIHIGRKGDEDEQNMTTVLHRWFEQARPHLFANLSYARFLPSAFNGLIPKINTSALAHAFEQLSRETNKTLAQSFAPRENNNQLYFKKSAYNWLCFCRILPPCYDSQGRRIEHTKFGTVYFTGSEDRDLAFLFLNGKIMFAYWCAIGDDFDVTRWMFSDFPIDIASIPDAARKELLPLAARLEESMLKNSSFKQNAGRKVGNYNLAKCRAVTGESDRIFARLLGLEDTWQDIELMYAQMVKTDFSENAVDKLNPTGFEHDRTHGRDSASASTQA